jgi:CHAT domain-containing protein
MAHPHSQEQSTVIVTRNQPDMPPKSVKDRAMCQRHIVVGGGDWRRANRSLVTLSACDTAKRQHTLHSWQG